MCIHKHEPQFAAHRTVIFENGKQRVILTPLYVLHNKEQANKATLRLAENRDYYKGRKTKMRKKSPN